MTWLRMLGARLADLFRRHQGDVELDEELQFHIDMEEAENRRKGMSAAQARRAARRSFGSVTGARESHREGRSIAAFETLAQDIRYGLRTMARNPGFTAVAVVTMALGIGVNSAIFSVTDAVLLRPLPYPEPHRIVEIGRDQGPDVGNLDIRMFKYLRERFRSCERFAAAMYNSGILIAGNQAEHVRTLEVTADYFSALGVAPALGRDFSPQDENQGAPWSVVLSNDLWRNRFASDPNVIGTTVQLRGRLHTVIGVMPRSFRSFPPRDAWTPLRVNILSGGANYRALGRLAPGITVDQARAELDALGQDYAREFAVEPRNSRFVAVDLQAHVGTPVRPALVALSYAVGLVLLIACANLACLLLARGSTRRKEIALRAALGGGRARIIRQLLTESILLAVLGGGLGVLLAKAGIQTLLALSPLTYSLWDVQVDMRVLLATLAASVVAGVVFGFVPAMEATKLDLRDSLQQAAGRASAGKRSALLRRTLVAAEVALCVTLLAGAGLLIRTFVNLRNVDLGFRPEGVVTAGMALDGQDYREPRRVAAFFAQALDRMRNLPGVEAAAAVNSIPVDRGWNLPIAVPHGASKGEIASVDWRFVTPQYLEVLKIPLLRGRGIAETDTLGATPVAVVNQEFVRRFFGDDDPLGSYVQLHKFTPDLDDPPRQIVGVIGDVKTRGLASGARPTMFVPRPQLPASLLTLGSVNWIVRTNADSGQVAAAMRQVIRSLDAHLTFSRVRTMEEVIDDSIVDQRFQMVLLSLFGTLALVMAATGIYGLVAYLVASRRHEIGIRMALGATRRDVAAQVIREGVLPVAAGAVAGLAASLGLAAVLQSFLFGVGASDPLTLAAVVVVIFAVGLGASLIPAGRAVRISPVAALREE